MPSGNTVSQLNPSPSMITYDRGSQAIIIPASVGTTNVPQVGTAQPVGATAYGIAPTMSRGQLPPNLNVQVDVTGTAAGTVTLLGSDDGVNFYSLGTITIVAGTGQLIAFAGILARYFCASLTGFAGAGSIQVSFSQ